MAASTAPPRVTVFMPVYNREQTLRPAIESVLAQSYRDFELLLIDDGSTDTSVEIVRSYGDPRVRLVIHNINRGIPATRNHGLELARGEYLALLDSDDLAVASRLQHQVRFLDAHADIAAVGSWLTKIDHNGRWRGWILRPTRPRDIRARILFMSCFKNPAMMARTELLRRFGYREEFRYCQDIDLWARISTHYRLANLPRFLTRYRSGGESRRDENLAFRLKQLAARYHLEEFGLDFDDRDLAAHVRLRNLTEWQPDAGYIEWCEDWLRRIVEHNAKRHAYPEPELSDAAAERWMLVAMRALKGRTASLRGLGRSAWWRRVPAYLARRAGHGAQSLPPAIASLLR
jgi:glycosyltransferase involved in cell wall biosynthesis